MTDAVSGVTTPSVTPVEIKKPDEATGSVATAPATVEPPTDETTESSSVGAGIAQGTPPEGAAKKLYITA